MSRASLWSAHKKPALRAALGVPALDAMGVQSRDRSSEVGDAVRDVVLAGEPLVDWTPAPVQRRARLEVAAVGGQLAQLLPEVILDNVDHGVAAGVPEPRAAKGLARGRLERPLGDPKPHHVCAGQP